MWCAGRTSTQTNGHLFSEDPDRDIGSQVIPAHQSQFYYSIHFSRFTPGFVSWQKLQQEYRKGGLSLLFSYLSTDKAGSKPGETSWMKNCDWLAGIACEYENLSGKRARMSDGEKKQNYTARSNLPQGCSTLEGCRTQWLALPIGT